MSGTFEKKFPLVSDGKTNCVVSTGAFKFLKELAKQPGVVKKIITFYLI